MAHAFTGRATFTVLAAVAATVGLSACGGEAEKTEYQTDVVDESGGELIVEDADQEGVDVNLPETQMTNVPEE